jgi:hypothetical protein
MWVSSTMVSEYRFCLMISRFDVTARPSPLSDAGDWTGDGMSLRCSYPAGLIAQDCIPSHSHSEVRDDTALPNSFSRPPRSSSIQRKN